MRATTGTQGSCNGSPQYCASRFSPWVHASRVTCAHLKCRSRGKPEIGVSFRSQERSPHSPRTRSTRAVPMSDDIPFDRTFDLPPGKVEEVVPGVRRLLANNPSPFTFKGTVSYIVGRGQVAIIDPGPLDEAHIAALLDAVRGETVTHVFVTHTHRDHSPA